VKISEFKNTCDPEKKKRAPVTLVTLVVNRRVRAELRIKDKRKKLFEIVQTAVDAPYASLKTAQNTA
jgi:hypothetical protein